MSTSNSNDHSFLSLPNFLSDYNLTIEESGLSTTASSPIFKENFDHAEIKNEDEESIENFHESKIRLSTISLRGMPETVQANDPSTRDEFSGEIKLMDYQSLKNVTNYIYDYVTILSDTEEVIKRKKSSDMFRKNKNNGGNRKRKKKVKILKASWKDEAGKDREVALKKVESLSVFDRNKNEMGRESLEAVENINLLRKLSYHQNLLRIFGYTVDPSTLNHFLVVQYANGGNLRKFLREHYTEITWKDKLRACTDLASGLKYIHDHDIVHLALHSRNILHHNHKFLISDLGISKSNISIPSSILPYTDPRYLADIKNYQRDKQSDVYALGILMHEISGGRIPYSEYLAKSDIENEIGDGCEKGLSYLPELLLKIINEDYRQQPIFGTPPEYVALYQQCWQADPTMRPSVDKVLKRLGVIEVGNEKVRKERTISEIEEDYRDTDKKEMNKNYNEKGDIGQKRDIIYVQDVGITSGTESGPYFSAGSTSYPTDSMIYSFADEELGKKKRRYFTKKKIIFAVFVCWLVIIVAVACAMIGVFVSS